MSVQGLCQVCGSARADDRCDRCGSLVCDDHLDSDLGICSECAAEFGDVDGPGRTDRDDGDHPDVDRYQF